MRVESGAGLRAGDVRRVSRAPASAAPGRASAPLWRRACSSSLALLGMLLVTSVLASGSAFAAGQRGHVFSFSFGSLGTGNGQFFHPSGVGVSASTGDLYVADRENGRLEEFKPALGTGGEVIGETFVKEVAAEFPEAVAVDNCVKVTSPTYEACDETEDPSVGDIYVATAKKGNKGALGEDAYVYKFNASLQEVWSKKFKENIYGLAVGPSGDLFVYGEEGKITALNNAVENVALAAKSVTSAADGRATRAFAVESGGNLYAGVLADNEEAPAKSALSELFGELAAEHVGLIAKLAGSNGRVLMHDLDYEEARAVAVNPSDVAANGVDEEDDVYVAEVAEVAGEQTSTIAAFSPSEGAGTPAEGEGDLLQRFAAPDLEEANGIAVDPRSGDVYVTDGASNRVDVFELEPAGKPTVSALAARSGEPPLGGSNATTLSAQVSPAGSSTHYYFEYGAASCSTSSCQTTASSSLTGAGFGEQTASAELLSLPAGAYHYRLVAENAQGTTDSGEQTFDIVEPLGALPDGRGWEMVSPPDKGGAEPEAPTIEGGLIEAAASGDAITYVADGTLPAEAEPEGARNPEFTQILSAREGGGEWITKDIDTPNESGAGPAPGEEPEYQFFSRSLALALVEPFPAASGTLASPPLSPPVAGENPSKREQENTPYVRDDAPVTPEPSEEGEYDKALENGASMSNAGFIPLVTKLNQPGANFGSEDQGGLGITIESATPDLSHILLGSQKAGSGLYEWSLAGGGEHKLQPVSVLPGSETPINKSEAFLGTGPGSKGRSVDVRHAVSEDGSLVFWTWQQGLEQHLYVRDTQLGETLQLSAEGPAHAIFQTASANGSKVFFTDTQRLPVPSGEEQEANLYVAEIKVVGDHLTSEVTDLTPERGAGLLISENVGDAAVLGASEEEAEGGAYVYFMANGALAPGARRGHCPTNKNTEPRPSGTTCNLYVRHYASASKQWEPTRLVAALSPEDGPDWDALGAGGFDYKTLTSRVSPNGRYLAFMSDRSLTGYDNEDASGQGRMDEEVYIYDAQRASLACASCNPDGARPTGVLDTHVADGEGLGLVVDRSEIWSTSQPYHADPWLAASVPNYERLGSERSVYQSRYLSNEGRLFFNSADPLLPVGSVPNEKRTKIEHTTEYGAELQVGIENVYEYEPAEVGGCDSAGGCIGLISSGKSEHESVFLDASEDGNDVFFLTAEKLAPQDVDTSFDVYDAHVCESTSPCPSAEATKIPCEGEGCQGRSASPPILPAPAILPFSGSGNVVLPKQVVLPEKASQPPAKLTRAQKLKKALKTCRKDKKKSKRLACEKQARKKYGPVKKKHGEATK